MRVIFLDGTCGDIPVLVQKQGGVTKVSVGADVDFSNIKWIDFEYEKNLAVAGDEGYFVLPNSTRNEGMLCRFRERDDTEYINQLYTMPIFGVKTRRRSFLAIVTGMAYAYTLVCGVKDGRYYVFPRFQLDGVAPYEEISVEYHDLPDDSNDYSAMARKYRRYQLERGACKPLKERIMGNAELDYARNSVMIRIRMGWKPVPPSVAEQSLETEPQMHVACTFGRVAELLDALKAVGVDRAEICLVGWNAKGHDGRWPSAFPVSEELGGEAGLRALIEKAQRMGYQIVCHTNSTDAYKVSPDFSEDDLRRDRDGNTVNSGYWSGGRLYELCPATALRQARETLPRVRELGFRGVHYIDVLSIVKPRDCHSPHHPLNVGQAIDCNLEIMRLSKELFGGFSSEGTMDFAAPYLDYGLYVSFSEDNQPPISDQVIPLWQLVYHGIILSNPSANTINYPIKGAAARMKLIEYGGRPSLYIHSKFVDTEKKSGYSNARNWMGEIDLTCGSDEELHRTVEKIAEAYQDAQTFSDLQTEFMEQHEEIAENVYRVTYSDNSTVTVDYNNCSYTLASGEGRNNRKRF